MRTKSDQTLAIEALVAEKPDIKASEALPLLKKQKYDVEAVTFNNVKCQFLKTLNGDTPVKVKKTPAPKLVKDASPVNAAVERIADEFGSLDDAKEYRAQLDTDIASVEAHYAQVSKLVG